MKPVSLFDSRRCVTLSLHTTTLFASFCFVVPATFAQVVTFNTSAATTSDLSATQKAAGVSNNPTLARVGLTGSSRSGSFTSTGNLVPSSTFDFTQKYVSFSVMPMSGSNVLFLSGISFGISGSSATGNAYAVGYSTDNFSTFKSSAGALTDVDAFQSFSSFVPLITNDTVQVRFQNYGTRRADGGSGNPSSGSNFRLGYGTPSSSNTPIQVGGNAPALTASITLAANTEIRNSATSLNLSGVISGAFGIEKTGSGTTTFSGSSQNTFNGLTTVSAGEIDLGKNANVVAIAGNLTIGDGTGGANADVVKLLNNGQINSTATLLINGTTGKLDLNGYTQTIGSLADTGTVMANGSSVTLGAGALTVGNANSTKFSGVISGVGSVTKIGGGTLTVAGTNSYTGATNIQAGTLALQTAGTNNIANSSQINIGSGAVLNATNVAGTGGFGLGTSQTLVGNGTVSGSTTTVGSTNTLSAGTGTTAAAQPGQLSTDGQIWTGGTYVAKFAGTTAAAAAGGTASTWDKLAINGTLNLSQLAAKGFALNLIKTTTGTFNPNVGQMFNILSATSITYPVGYSATNIADLFVLNTDGLGIAYADEGMFSVGASGGDVWIAYEGEQSPAPEPASAALAVLGSSVVLGRRRRRSDVNLWSAARRMVFGAAVKQNAVQ